MEEGRGEGSRQEGEGGGRRKDEGGRRKDEGGRRGSKQTAMKKKKKNPINGSELPIWPGSFVRIGSELTIWQSSCVRRR